MATSAERKLENLRLKMNQARVLNNEEVIKFERPKKRPATIKDDEISIASMNRKGVGKEDHDFKEYKKRVKELPGLDECQAVGVELLAESAMKAELKRKNFSRRRAFNEDADVTYINEKNRKFNEQLVRAFGGKKIAALEININRQSS